MKKFIFSFLSLLAIANISYANPLIAEATRQESVSEQSHHLNSPPISIEKNTINELSWNYQGAMNYEQQNPGYGVSYKFTSMQDAIADVYIYDFGRKNWLEGINDKELKNVIDVAKQEIVNVQTSGAYQNVTFGELTISKFSNQNFYVLPINFYRDMIHFKSFIYLTVLNHKILKFRISYLNPTDLFDYDQITQKFIENTLKELRNINVTTS